MRIIIDIDFIKDHYEFKARTFSDSCIKLSAVAKSTSVTESTPEADKAAFPSIIPLTMQLMLSRLTEHDLYPTFTCEGERYDIPKPHRVGMALAEKILNDNNT